MSHKLDRIESSIGREISRIILEEAQNDMIKNISITKVTVDDDLTFAKVYFMTRNEDIEKTTDALNNASGFIRKNLAHSLDLRSTPELKFVYDKSIDYTEKIENIIDSLEGL